MEEHHPEEAEVVGPGGGDVGSRQRLSVAGWRRRQGRHRFGAGAATLVGVGVGGGAGRIQVTGGPERQGLGGARAGASPVGGSGGGGDLGRGWERSQVGAVAASA